MTTSMNPILYGQPTWESFLLVDSISPINAVWTSALQPRLGLAHFLCTQLRHRFLHQSNLLLTLNPNPQFNSWLPSSEIV
jgi:hypothetical protein